MQPKHGEPTAAGDADRLGTASYLALNQSQVQQEPEEELILHNARLVDHERHGPLDCVAQLQQLQPRRVGRRLRRGRTVHEAFVCMDNDGE